MVSYPKDSIGAAMFPGSDPDMDLPFGDLVYALVRHQGTLIDVYPNRHDALTDKTKLEKSADEFEIVPTPVGQIRLRDATRVFKRGGA